MDREATCMEADRFLYNHRVYYIRINFNLVGEFGRLTSSNCEQMGQMINLYHNNIYART